MMLMLAVTQWAWQRPVAVLGLSFVASLTAFILYAIDKAAARRGSRRIAENTLHLWSLLGGWPGALAAQRIFRHKTSKTSFQIVFWITVALNCGAAIWLLSPAGARAFRLPLLEQTPAREPTDLPRITPGSPRGSARNR